ncbi:MAG: RAMP superfamily CRISPR-associated protein [Defluviicoccus sp.]
MNATRLLTIDIRSWWHAGTGRGGGEDADAVVERDHDGLPFLPGRHVKGLLRDAAFRLEHWGALQSDTTRLLFGNDPEAERELNHEGFRRDTHEGGLRISNATLPLSVRAQLRKAEKGTSRAALFGSLANTAIDEARGVAKSKSLRRTEVTIPLRLTSNITWSPPPGYPGWNDRERAVVKSLETKWPHLLSDEILPLVRAVGAHRSRGLGRATLSLPDARS